VDLNEDQLSPLRRGQSPSYYHLRRGTLS